MRPMTSLKRGDVVLVNFIFSEKAGAKQRPALIVSTAAYHQRRQEAMVVAITSNVAQQLAGDHILTAWQEAGLVYPSRVTAILRTVRRGMITRRLGSLKRGDLQTVEQNLRSVLGL
ncbi:MAG: hypothetical protein A2Z21_10390 [Candidatus Fraserbacteria bacterium RBG_16_55_9]|uniref:Type II toxin-antitoxin system PemK/MazF family toxin n=1 Tax=Fraserbacteria sp. (strain RBG_16_55_9) TaxID=1817864 RepID=A0A1F5URS8_FRAXR|nr:MAG: hypothetical protein A2Z21_10390 [Candidatus Fraserbacteria bacterium RBG_16_55_9]